MLKSMWDLTLAKREIFENLSISLRMHFYIF